MRPALLVLALLLSGCGKKEFSPLADCRDRMIAANSSKNLEHKITGEQQVPGEPGQTVAAVDMEWRDKTTGSSLRSSAVCIYDAQGYVKGGFGVDGKPPLYPLH